MNTFKDEPTKQAPNASGKVSITVDNLPDELRDMLDKTLINYDNQTKLQKLDPNYVPYGIGLRALGKEFKRHLNRLQKIQQSYFKGASFTLADDGEPVTTFFSDDSTTSQCSMIWEEDPQELMAELIDGANKVYDTIKGELEGIPSRKPGRNEDRALNPLCSDITAVYVQAGGIPNVASHDAYEQNKEPIEESDQEQPKALSPFVGFALEVMKMAGIEIESEREFADRLRPFIRQQVENNK